MPKIDAPKLAETVLLLGSGDVCMSPGKNAETLKCDTLLLTVSRPGEIGPVEETDREQDAIDAGMAPGVVQSKPATVALRFTSEKSIVELLLTVAELYGQARGFAGDPDGTASPLAPLKAALQADPSFAQGWHDNLAMAAYDEDVEIGRANRIASRFMRSAFDVETW